MPSCRPRSSLSLSATRSILLPPGDRTVPSPATTGFRCRRAVSTPSRDSRSGQSAVYPLSTTARLVCRSLPAVTLPVSRRSPRPGCARLHLSVDGATTPTGSAVQSGGICAHRRMWGASCPSAATGWGKEEKPCQGTVPVSPGCHDPRQASFGLACRPSGVRSSRTPRRVPVAQSRPLLPTLPPLAWATEGDGWGLHPSAARHPCNRTPHGCNASWGVALR